jgi:hypothetical protein
MRHGWHETQPRLVGVLLAAAPSVGLLEGCAHPTARPPLPSLAASGSDSSIAAVAHDQAIPWSDLIPALAEIAGATALREAALDHALRREMARRGLALDPDATARERARLQTELDAGASDLDAILASRSVGPSRLDALLTRRAMLRALTADARVVTEGQIALAHALMAGPRHRVRVLAFPDERSAAQARAELAALSDPAAIAEAFRARSPATDNATALSGEISTRDPLLPEALRAAVDAAEPGGLTRVFALTGGAGLALVEQTLPATDDPLTPALRQRLAEQLANRLQAIAMDDLAQRLVHEARVAPLHPALGWSWRQSNQPE